MFYLMTAEPEIMVLTRRQKQILDYVSESIRKNGYAPSLTEISRHFNLHSISTVHKHLAHLEAKGLIRRTWNRARAIELLPLAARPLARDIPLTGLVSAGQPLEPVRGTELIAVPEDLIGRREVHILKVRGESLADEQLRDGDYLIVERRDHPQSGEMVVALVREDRVAVRKFYREKGRVRLQPSQPTLKAVVIDPGEIKVQGIVVGMIRKY
jgi:repressor LexA